MKFTPNENILRVALIIFSILFGILSVSLIALGIVYIDELIWPKKYVDLDFIELPTLLIILGSLSLAMAIAGCFCAKTYSRILLLTFAAVLLIILCLELTIAVIAFNNFKEHESSNRKTQSLMFEDYNSQDEETRVFFQELEDHYKCCGVIGNETECLSDYVDDEISENNGLNTTNTYLSLNGCAPAVDAQVQLVSCEIGYFCSVLALLQVIEIGYVFLIRRSLQEYHSA